MMKRLTAEQRLNVRAFLTEQGVTFSPLVEEMLDHVSSDIEERMHEGLSFDEAWHQMKNDIPENHLQNIQIETMETINKRFSVSRALSILALALMFGGIIFRSCTTLVHLNCYYFPLPPWLVRFFREPSPEIIFTRRRKGLCGFYQSSRERCC
jgi:hypothetical protein